jgi:arginine/lysine/ornithine decarboxylase
MRELKSVEYMSMAFSDLPKVEMSPVHAYEHLVKNDVEVLTLDQAANRVAAVAIVPYPPGIPMSIPGENMGPANGPIIGYLKSLEAFDTRFPGFGHDTHGVENINGKYHIHCLKKNTSSAKTKK